MKYKSVEGNRKTELNLMGAADGQQRRSFAVLWCLVFNRTCGVPTVSLETGKTSPSFQLARCY